MVVARRLRRSAAYLYLKAYATSLLVTAFAARPITRRLSPEHARTLQRLIDLDRRHTAAPSPPPSAQGRESRDSPRSGSGPEGSGRDAVGGVGEDARGGRLAANGAAERVESGTIPAAGQAMMTTPSSTSTTTTTTTTVSSDAHGGVSAASNKHVAAPASTSTWWWRPPVRRRLVPPFALKSLSLDPDSFLPHHWSLLLSGRAATRPAATADSSGETRAGSPQSAPGTHPRPAEMVPGRLRQLAGRAAMAARRWKKRAHDLASVRRLMEADAVDTKRYPEVKMDARVRRSRELHPGEKRFLERRAEHIASEGSLQRLLLYFDASGGGLASPSWLTEEERDVLRRGDVPPEDIPLVALGGSGGGYRAMYGFAAAIEALQQPPAPQRPPRPSKLPPPPLPPPAPPPAMATANQARCGPAAVACDSAGSTPAEGHGSVWDVCSWVVGVSGSCWTIAGLYTIASLRARSLLSHYAAMAHEGQHPMSRDALDTVARSSRGVYFLLAPLLAKASSGIVGLGIMDLYATMTTCYQLLSRSPHARPGLSRATFQMSKLAQRLGLDKGHAPLPILTAVRRVFEEPTGATVVPREPRGGDRVERKCGEGTSPDASPLRVRDAGGGNVGGDDVDAPDPTPKGAAQPARGVRTRYQWWDMTPYEVGSADVGAGVPTWAFGRTFVDGVNKSRRPETSLALLVGYCTSAPAGPLTGYLAALLASVPRGTLAAYLVDRINRFVSMKRWERRWANPIRGADEPNPFFGLGTTPSAAQTGRGEGGDGRESDGRPKWEAARRIKLMDSGLSNNLPNHVLAGASRQADVIFAWDGSSDVKTGAALARLGDFARERGVALRPRDPLPPPLELPPYVPSTQRKKRLEIGPAHGGGGDADTGDEADVDGSEVFAPSPLEAPRHAERTSRRARQIRERYAGRYAQVFDGWRVDGSGDGEVGLLPHRARGGGGDSDSDGPAPHFRLIYAPLLPHASHAHFDPTAARFATSYNLVWSPEQVGQLRAAVRGAVEEHVAPAVARAVLEAWRQKRRRRLSAEAQQRSGPGMASKARSSAT